MQMVVEADRAGVDYVWLGDSHLVLRDAYVALAACALNTSSIRLGTSITPIVTRHPVAIANAACTLNELSNGRFILGIGIGDSSVRMIGKEPATIEYLEESVKTIRMLAQGEPFGDYKMASATGSLPIYYFPTGRNMLLAAGRVAEGAMINPGGDLEFLRYSLGLIREGAESAGRDFSTIHIGAWSAFAVDDDRKAALDDVKPLLARTMMRPVPLDISGLSKDQIIQVKNLYDYAKHMDVDQRAKELVPDYYAERFAISGTPRDCIGKIKEISALGVHSIHVVIMNKDKTVGTRRLLEEVIPGSR
jgi:5,10-methylenetetrahydromethanopterin reductase